MLRLGLISLHSTSGAGCSARPFLMGTPDDFLLPQFVLLVTSLWRPSGRAKTVLLNHVRLEWMRAKMFLTERKMNWAINDNHRTRA